MVAQLNDCPDSKVFQNADLQQVIDLLKGRSFAPIQIVREGVTVFGIDEAGAVSLSPDGALPASNYFVYPGMIVLWDSADPVPPNYAICDGTNGTPDLRDRFPVGAGGLYTRGATGGAATSDLADHTHTSAEHAHDMNHHHGFEHDHDFSHHHTFPHNHSYDHHHTNHHTHPYSIDHTHDDMVTETQHDTDSDDERHVQDGTDTWVSKREHKHDLIWGEFDVPTRHTDDNEASSWVMENDVDGEASSSDFTGPQVNTDWALDNDARDRDDDSTWTSTQQNTHWDLDNDSDGRDSADTTTADAPASNTGPAGAATLAIVPPYYACYFLKRLAA